MTVGSTGSERPGDELPRSVLTPPRGRALPGTRKNRHGAAGQPGHPHAQGFAEARKHRRPLGRHWYTDEMFFFRDKDKGYQYRAVDEHCEVVDVLRQHRDIASAEAFFEQALGRSGQTPNAIITDHHQPYVKAIQRTVPTAVHIRSGLHRATGHTTKPIERSHVPTRDRLRASRGLKTLPTGRRFLEGFECLRALRGGHIRLADLLPAFSASASVHDHVPTVAAAVLVLGMRLNRNPRPRRW